MKQPQVFHAVLQRQTPAFPAFLTKNKREGRLHDLFVRISNSCWSFDPTERPTMKDLVQQCISFFHLDQILGPSVLTEIVLKYPDLRLLQQNVQPATNEISHSPSAETVKPTRQSKESPSPDRLGNPVPPPLLSSSNTSTPSSLTYLTHPPRLRSVESTGKYG